MHRRDAKMKKGDGGPTKACHPRASGDPGVSSRAFTQRADARWLDSRFCGNDNLEGSDSLRSERALRRALGLTRTH
jgi:hypothetical protein